MTKENNLPQNFNPKKATLQQLLELVNQGFIVNISQVFKDYELPFSYNSFRTFKSRNLKKKAEFINKISTNKNDEEILQPSEKEIILDKKLNFNQIYNQFYKELYILKQFEKEVAADLFLESKKKREVFCQRLDSDITYLFSYYCESRGFQIADQLESALILRIYQFFLEDPISKIDYVNYKKNKMISKKKKEMK